MNNFIFSKIISQIIDSLNFNSFKSDKDLNIVYNLISRNRIQILGNLNTIFLKGTSKIEDVKFITPPSSSFILLFACDDIKLIKKKSYKLKKNEIILDNKYYLMFTINIRDCNNGEIFIQLLSM